MKLLLMFLIGAFVVGGRTQRPTTRRQSIVLSGVCLLVVAMYFSLRVVQE